MGTEFYKGTEHYTNIDGSYFEVKFEGAGIKWYGVKSPNCGKAQVYINDVLVDTVDCYQANREVTVLFDSDDYYVLNLMADEHKLKVVLIGNGYITTDRFDIKIPAYVPEVPNTDWISIDDSNIGTGINQVTYSANWTSFRGAEFYNTTEHYTNIAGSYFEVKFDGTGIKWYGVNDASCGRADVYIDGRLVDVIDGYKSNREVGAILFDSDDYNLELASGIHTLKVVVRSDKHISSTGNFITADRFDIKINL